MEHLTTDQKVAGSNPAGCTRTHPRGAIGAECRGESPPETHARDDAFLAEALAEARAASEEGEVPVGALVVRDGAVVARARNRVEADRDPTAHAERLALAAAARAGGYARLLGCTVYSTVEPCFMCAGAILLARPARLVFGVRDPKFGACGSLADLPRDPRLNHRLEVVEGIRADECRELLRGFFARRRLRAGRVAR